MSTQKSFLKKVVLTNAQYEQRKSAGTLEEGVEYCISDALDAVESVTINGTSIVDATTHVANIPHASVNASGVIKTGASFNTNVLSSGYMQAVTNTYEQYQGKGNDAFIGKGTLENVLDNETVRVDKATSLTDTQKSQGRNNIAAIAMAEYDSTAASYEENILYYVTE